ncbi:uncharacterized protein LOC134945529 isoform X2 [Pseudophryne corroboree]|uniref:uncharacterized protein LOC134945529 isoform X2 n=1 Tax=Pseudophryne corroboree TaxID=495146 RepID=UPI003081459A
MSRLDYLFMGTLHQFQDMETVRGAFLPWENNFSKANSARMHRRRVLSMTYAVCRYPRAHLRPSAESCAQCTQCKTVIFCSYLLS